MGEDETKTEVNIEIKNETNDELIDKFEELVNEYSVVIKKMILKIINEEMSDEQRERINRISGTLTADAFDMMMSKGADKNWLKNNLLNVVDECTDKNR